MITMIRLQQEATDKNITEDLPTSGKQNIVTDEEALRNKFSKASTEISKLNKGNKSNWSDTHLIKRSRYES